MNEFDRFVRHRVKPLAYVRYGDDFVLIGRSKTVVENYQKDSEEFLQNRLSLKINSRNNVTIKTKYGIKFLGHEVYNNCFVLSNKSYRIALKQLNEGNRVSYLGMSLSKKQRSNLVWK